MTKTRLIVAMVALAGLGLAAGGAGRRAPVLTDTDAYHRSDVEGWPVRISPALRERPELEAAALREVERQLREVRRVLPAGALERLDRVVIWLETDGYRRPQYHISGGWLRDNGYNPDKAGGIEVGDARAFTRPRPPGHHALALLHELAHAYHHQVLGFDDERVIEAYERAVESGDYDSVLRDDGRTARHYGLVNHHEYFAEASEAFFVVNDFYPFIRAELREHDPHTHDLLAKLWGE